MTGGDPSTEPDGRTRAEDSEGGAIPARRTRWDTWSHRLEYATLSLGALALVLATVLFVRVEPATAFETSLVDQFPPAFWVAFYTVLVAGVLGCLLAGASGSGRWRHAVALVVADYALFFFLPLARGYRLYGRGAADVLVHVGDAKGILETGTLAAGSWYPMQHALVSELVYLGWPLQVAPAVLAYSFTAVYVLSMGYLVRTMTGRGRTTAYGLAAGTPLVFSVFQITLIPSFLSLLLFPTVLAILEGYRRTRRPAFLALFVVFGVGIVFFHPVTAGFLVVLLLSTTAYGIVFVAVTDREVRRLRTTLAFVVAAATFVWYVNFRETESSIRQVHDAWFSGSASPGEAAVEGAASVPLSTAELVTRFVELYGMVFVFLLAGVVFALVVFVATLLGRVRYEEAFATTQFAVGAAIAVTFFAVNLIEFEPIRIARYMIVMAVFLYALLLVHATGWRPRRRRIAIVLFSTGIVVATVLGANAAYWPNQQLTDAEYEGTQHLLEHGQDDVEIRTYSIGHKMQWYVETSVSPDLWPPRIETSLPRGFGYDSGNATVAASLDRSYVAIHEFDRTFYTDDYYTPAQRRALVRFETSDLERLNRDPTANRIYDSGGFEAWFVPGSRNATG